jgi:NHL repeat-containing protein
MPPPIRPEIPNVPPPVDVYVGGSHQSPLLRIEAVTGDVRNIPGDPDAQGVAADAAENVFLAIFGGDNPGVVKIPAVGGAPKQLVPGFGTFGVAADWEGNAYAVGMYGAARPDLPGMRALKLPVNGGEPAVIWTGTATPWAIAVDGHKNVYILHHQPVQVVKVPTGGGPHRVYDFPGVFWNDFTPAFAVDPQGQHLYFALSDFPHDVILKIPINGGPHTRLGTGLSGVQGVAVDADGNVYVADTFNGRVVMIRADSGAQSTICQIALPVPIAVEPTRAYRWDEPDLVGQLFGGVAVDGGGWLVVGGHFIPIPPRSPIMPMLLRMAGRYLGHAVENGELAEQLSELRPPKR